jgi:hypothetical protein
MPLSSARGLLGLIRGWLDLDARRRRLNFDHVPWSQVDKTHSALQWILLRATALKPYHDQIAVGDVTPLLALRQRRVKERRD